MSTALPFGLSTACYIFIKAVRPLAWYWRTRGLRILVYLDDGLCPVSGEQAAVEASQLVQRILEMVGFVTPPEKSIWQPMQCLTWLGFVVDVALGQIEVLQGKIETLRDILSKVLLAPRIHAKTLASIIGQVISMSLAFGSVGRFRTRSLYTVLESRWA